MEEPFNISFSNGNIAKAVNLNTENELPNALNSVGLQPPKHNLVLIGGAAGLDKKEYNRLKPLFYEVLNPLAKELDLCVLDGGTDSGVMKLMGESRSYINGTFPLLGVSTLATISYPDNINTAPEAAQLESHHSHFIFVPGITWGDEAPWLARLATTLAKNAPSLAVLINGGEFARMDVEECLSAKRPLLVVSGTGRLADELASQNVMSNLIHIIELDKGSNHLYDTFYKFFERIHNEQI